MLSFFFPYDHTGRSELHITVLKLGDLLASFGPASGASLGDWGLRKARPHGCRGRIKAAEVQC